MPLRTPHTWRSSWPPTISDAGVRRNCRSLGIPTKTKPHGYEGRPSGPRGAWRGCGCPFKYVHIHSYMCIYIHICACIRSTAVHLAARVPFGLRGAWRGCGCPRRTLTHALTHTHTHTHTHKHTHTHTLSHAHAHTLTLSHSHTHTLTFWSSWSMARLRMPETRTPSGDASSISNIKSTTCHI